MNFFEHQDTARRKTFSLVFYFILAIVLTVLAVYVAVVCILNLSFDSSADGQKLLFSVNWIWNPQLFLIVTTITVVLILTGTIFKIISLGKGGSSVARELGGKIIPPTTTDYLERRLLNVVEEMAIASGIAVPPVYIIDDDSINAFAAGYTPNSAIVGVTKGTMQLLSRDELQGVVAHEFSHILNGDMRLNIRLMGFLHGLLLIALTGYWMLRAMSNSGARRTSSKKEGGGIALAWALMGIAFVAIGYIGVLFGKLIKAAVSRQREFLADSSAVQFTRNPLGISGALKKIGGFYYGSRISSPNAEEVSHMFFADGLSRTFLRMFSTHPELPERIKRIDPSFNGNYPEVNAEQLVAAFRAEESKPQAAQKKPPLMSPTGMMGAIIMGADKLVQQVGNPGAEHIAYAENLLASLPPSILEKIRTAEGAKAIVYSLILDPNEHARESQLTFVAKQESAEVIKAIRGYMEQLPNLPANYRLPLLDLSLSALRTLTKEQYASFRNIVYQLATADGKFSLFEYTLQRVLIRHLDPHFQKAKSTKVRFNSISEVAKECRILLSALAISGNSDKAAINAAYANGYEILGLGETPPILDSAHCGLTELDHALNNLALCAPLVKETVLRALTTTVSTDGKVTPEEAELLRATADCLDCPVPPILG